MAIIVWNLMFAKLAVAGVVAAAVAWLAHALRAGW
jgi:hypothetical protein